jgi:TATA-binding protein-associated factor Taf7
MAKAELYKDKVATLETTIADLTAKLGKASVPAIRENFEKDLKKANADKKKYEGIM